MSNNPIRRGQLIAPFGVGAMIVAKNGTSMVTGALDYWYRRESGHDPSPEALQEFRVEEWRLQQRLGVGHFRLPPDWRTSEAGQGVPNAYLSVPFLKFPTWYSCRKCGLMTQTDPTDSRVPKCESCEKRGWFGRMVQVPIVAVCQQGHLMEFPWREWAHRSHRPSCTKPMRLVSMAGATLASKFIKCECGAGRNLSGVTSGGEDGNTVLTQQLSDTPFLCQGQRAWTGVAIGEECGSPVRGSLRNALNVYYADVQSAIFLPVGSGSVPAELLEQIRPSAQALLSSLAHTPLDEDTKVTVVVSNLLAGSPTLEDQYGREVLGKAVHLLLNPHAEAPGGAEEQFSDETVFRHEEHLALRTDRQGDDLSTQVQDLGEYPGIAPYLACVTLAEKIKETRVLNGFARVNPPDQDDFEERQRLMWVNPPSPEDAWLPAQVVYGEGIYLSLDEDRLREWEMRPAVQNRIAKLAERAVGARTLPTPRLVLLHTLSHLLMNQLTFSCGYSSATLRERLYASSDERTRMAGILIYTAEGDADGTLGGLVRMGKGANFTAMFQQAIMNASWCSADPVCMEAGDHGGQGPGSLNLAACHSCALVPETACEQFNRFLDRGLVVGTPEQPELGFFADLLLR